MNDERHETVQREVVQPEPAEASPVPETDTPPEIMRRKPLMQRREKWSKKATKTRR